MKPLSFVTGPVQIDSDGDALREELGRALSEATGEPFAVIAEISYGHLLDRVLAGAATIAWMPPALFARAHHARRFDTPFRAERLSVGRYQSALFVRAGSPIRTAADLARKRVAWVDRDSCAGYLFPRLALRAEAVDPDDCFSSELFAGSHARVVRAVESGDTDAGATYVQLAEESASGSASTIAIAGWTAFTDARAMRAILVSRSIPNDAVCIASGLEPALHERLRAGLATFHERPEGARMLRTILGCDRLIAGAPSDYDDVREALRAEGRSV
jgi:phosphonate transport system substrate-binding protein